MKKSCLWRKMTSGLMAAAVTVTAMPGLGLTMVQAEEKKTLKVAMECSYAPYNWTQPDDSNGAVPISGSSDYAYGYDVMMAKKICDELGYDLEIVKLDWDSLVPAVQSGKVDCVIAGQSITSERQQMVDFTEPYYYASIITLAACVAYPDFKLLDFSGTDGDFEVSDEDINIGISVQKGNTELLDALNSVLDKMTEDDYTEMMDEAISVQPLSE